MAPTQTELGDMDSTEDEGADEMPPSEEHEYQPGDFARDTVEESVVFVVGCPDERANECEIEALGGLTPAECYSNRAFDEEAPVVEVVYVESVNREYGNGEWTLPDILADRLQDTLDTNIYSMPAERLEPAGEAAQRSD